MADGEYDNDEYTNAANELDSAIWTLRDNGIDEGDIIQLVKEACSNYV